MQKKAKQDNKPKLGKNAQKKFDAAVAAIHDGIVNVGSLRQRDKHPLSMTKSEWDCMYIERVFGIVAGAISTDIRAITESLTKQAQEQLAEIEDKNKKETVHNEKV